MLFLHRLVARGAAAPPPQVLFPSVRAFSTSKSASHAHHTSRQLQHLSELLKVSQTSPPTAQTRAHVQLRTFWAQNGKILSPQLSASLAHKVVTVLLRIEPRLAVSTLENMTSSGVPLLRGTYSAAVTYLSENNLVENFPIALRIVRQAMQSGVGLEDTALAPYVSACLQAGLLAEAKATLERMGTIDAALVAKLLRGMALAGSAEEMEHFVAQLRSRGHRATEAEYMELIDARFMTGDSAGAARILNQMMFSGIRPSRDSYIALARMFLGARDFDKTLNMLRDGLKLFGGSCDALLQLLVHIMMQRPALIPDVFEIMDSVEFDTERAGEVAQGKLIAEMLERSIEDGLAYFSLFRMRHTSEITYAAVLGKLARLNQTQIFEKVLGDAARAGVYIGDVDVYQPLSAGTLERSLRHVVMLADTEAALDQAIELVWHLARHGTLKVGAAVFNAIVEQLLKADRIDEALDIARADLFEPDAVTEHLVRPFVAALIHRQQQEQQQQQQQQMDVEHPTQAKHETKKE